MKQKNHKQNFCGLNSRRIVALRNLEESLKIDHKNTKTGAVALTNEDKKRIEKEINVLQSRIVSKEVALATRHKRKKN
jgi:stress response protein YsnF